MGATPPAPVAAGCFGPIAPGGDGPALTRLASAPITAVKPNRGGSSVTLRVRFDDGGRAVFKPEQKHWRVGHRAEIAAYHLDRRLCFLRTAPVAGRSLDAKLLRRHLEANGADEKFLKRFDDEVIVRDGHVDGALIAWHEKSLANAEPPRGWSDADGGAVTSELAARLPEYSDMMVFDFVADNSDRFSGGNVLSLGKGGPLIFLDNAAGFTPWRKDTTLEKLMKPLCRFRRATVEALRAVGPAAAPGRRLSALLEASLARDALAPVLNKAQLAAADARLAALLEHVDGCVDSLGRDTVLSL